jgi:hypothetical protein
MDHIGGTGGPTFSRGEWLRIIAVALILGLGFLVVQAVRGS